jgi:hypothetical protein
MATVQRTLQRSELRILAILGVPTFALALAITTVSTYLPVLAEDFSDSSIVIGLLIGGDTAPSIRTSSTMRSPAARRAVRRSSAASGPSSPWSAAACSSRSPIRCPSWPPRSSSG